MWLFISVVLLVLLVICFSLKSKCDHKKNENYLYLLEPSYPKVNIPYQPPKYHFPGFKQGRENNVCDTICRRSGDPNISRTGVDYECKRKCLIQTQQPHTQVGHAAKKLCERKCFNAFPKWNQGEGDKDYIQCLLSCSENFPLNRDLALPGFSP